MEESSTNSGRSKGSYDSRGAHGALLPPLPPVGSSENFDGDSVEGNVKSKAEEANVTSLTGSADLYESKNAKENGEEWPF